MEQNRCRTCGSPVASQMAGSITQWISSCSCYLAKKKTDQKQLLSVSVSICTKCGKRIHKNNGSLTQWIFGESCCSCKSPLATKKSINTFVETKEIGSIKSQKSGTAEDSNKQSEDTPALENVSEDFPHERYSPLAELGKGASGIVYLCRDKLLNKKVALKTLSTLTDDQLVSFQNEARTTSKLDHPDLITILDFGASKNGAPYMVMEYFPGISLEHYLRDYGQLAPEIARKAFIKVAEVLQYTHDNNVLHRDLKPSNILISVHGENVEIKLIDFGIAKVKEDSGIVTIYQDKTLAGTPSYMAPDTVSGLTYDARSEIYSLGCILYESLTLEPVFRGKTALEILNKHAQDKPPKINKFDEFKDDEEWSKIIDKCLAKKKDDRFETMKDVSFALSELNIEAASEDIDRASKHSALSKNILISTILLLLISGTIFYIYFNNNSEQDISKVEDVTTLVKTADKLVSGKNKDWSKAILWYEKAAQKGDPKSQLTLTKAYYYGNNGKKKDYSKTLYWAKKGADANHAESIVNLGGLYLQGIGVKKDEKKTFELYLRAAKMNDPDAQMRLGMLYFNGTGTDQDYQKSFEWSLKAAKQGQPRAQAIVGELYLKGSGVQKNRDKALVWIKKACKQGEASAFRILGNYYDLKNTVNHEYKKSFNLYKKAVDLGDIGAMNSLGVCYKGGFGVKKDLKKAFYWYQKAADAGLDIGMRRLGDCYYWGSGIEQNYQKAFQWYMKAAEKSYDTKSRYKVGYCYDKGHGVQQDFKKAMHWYQKAAIKDDDEAMHEIGHLYYYGHGVKKDYKEAINWYQKAIEKGNDEAIFSLAHCFEYGEGVKKNMPKAISIYKVGASKREEHCLNRMGLFYLKGQGVKKDLEQAVVLFRAAAAKGNEEAEATLKKLGRNLD